MEIVFKIFLAFILSFVTVSTSICYAIERYNHQVNIKFLKKLVRVSDILFVLFLAIFLLLMEQTLYCLYFCFPWFSRLLFCYYIVRL